MGTYRGVDLMIYEATYQDKDGTTKFYLEPDVVLVGCSQNKGRMGYAAISQVNDDETNLTVIAGKRVPLVWFPDDAEMRKVRLASRPCPVPPDPSNWTIITGAV